MSEDLGERTEQPTERKRSDARERGQVARSQDFGAAVELIGAFLLVVGCGAMLTRELAIGVRLTLEPAGVPDAGIVISDGARLASRAVFGAIPIIGGVVVATVLGQFMQVGVLFSSTPLKPDLKRLSPMAGLSRIFGTRGLAKSTVNIVRTAAVIAIAAPWIATRIGEIASLASLPLMPAVMTGLGLAVDLTIVLLVCALILGAVDWMYQRWQHTSDLRMTRQEVRDERRMMDGDPEMKARRLRMMRQIAMHQVGRDVPKADVIVTNPTHYSVALQYDAATMNAPRVVAKGVDAMAMRIREIARASSVPIIERPPLARALYYGVDVGRDVPAEYYQAVAEILAYVYRLESAAA